MAFNFSTWSRNSSQMTFSSHQAFLQQEIYDDALRLYQPKVAAIIRPELPDDDEMVNATAVKILTEGTEWQFNSAHTTREMANLQESLRQIQNEHKEYPGNWQNAMLCIVAPGKCTIDSKSVREVTVDEDADARHLQFERICKFYPFIDDENFTERIVSDFREADQEIRKFLTEKKGTVHRAIIMFNGHGGDGGLAFDDEQGLVGEDKFYEAISKGLNSQTPMTIRTTHVVFAQCFSHTLRSMKNPPFVSVRVFPLSTPDKPATSYGITFSESTESQELLGDRTVKESTHFHAEDFARRHSSAIFTESQNVTVDDNDTVSDVLPDNDETLMDEACALPDGDSSAAKPSSHMETDEPMQ